ncbi:PadR family transcriptional regulator AphA [Branchiibius hedensis]|uniref:DNA-binding transcriptional regulator, PadR family n=1 Tax=Branchiibius hedensis TaxID=672460 RepID=A0A2Y8ZPG2_9MICO|nr:PadR family transcriptional regulator AphA [Branchiibius hedensis]SSA34220.1 DNA-binding transcriptional regulator, PadR family [Branchiibius hedensis]
MLGHALLGMLARAPGTGYDLSQRMQRTISFYWTWQHSQIYGALRQLDEHGLIRHRVIAGAGPRDTKRYSLTAAGRRALTTWVGTTPEAHDDRDPLLLRVHSLWTVDRAAATALLQQARADSVERLAYYTAIAQEIAVDGHSADPAHPDFASYATVQAGIIFRRGRIEWCDGLLAALDGATLPAVW